MKKLYFLSHHVANCGQGDVDPGILTLARHEGRVFGSRSALIFVDQLPQTRQIAVAFCQGLGLDEWGVMEEQQIQAPKLFAEIYTSDFRAAAQTCGNNFLALKKSHPENKIRRWAEQILASVNFMLGATNEGCIAVAFAFSPVVELACWIVEQRFGAPEDWFALADLEGLVITYDNHRLNNPTRVREKIRIRPAPIVAT